MTKPSVDKIRQRLRDELETILGAAVQQDDEQKPLHELGVDSMGLVELLVMIEKEYGQALMESGLSADHFRSVASLASAIHERLP